MGVLGVWRSALHGQNVARDPRGFPSDSRFPVPLAARINRNCVAMGAAHATGILARASTTIIRNEQRSPVISTRRATTLMEFAWTCCLCSCIGSDAGPRLPLTSRLIATSYVCNQILTCNATRIHMDHNCWTFLSRICKQYSKAPGSNLNKDRTTLLQLNGLYRYL